MSMPRGAGRRAARAKQPRRRADGVPAKFAASAAPGVEAPRSTLLDEPTADPADGTTMIPARPATMAGDGAGYEAEQAPRRAGRGGGRRRLLLLVALLLLALLATDLMVYKPWQGATAPPGRVPAPLPLADVDPIGAHLFLHKEVDSFKKKRTISLLYEGGFAWVRQEFPWHEIEIDKKNDFNDYKNGKLAWLKFDEIVQRAGSSGLRIIARIDRAPHWARPTDPDADFPLRNVDDYADFVRTFVTRYKGRVQAIQLWNEPNLQAEWLGAGQPVDPAGYARLLKAAYKAAKEADPNIIVLSAPLATTNEEDGNLRETIYLDRMYEALEEMYAGDKSCKYCFDVVAANGFGLDRPPEEAPSPELLNFRRTELLRQVMEQRGDAAKPIWFTEYGWNGAPTSLAQEQQNLWRRVSLVEQADYTVRGIRYAREHWPWAGVFSIWYFRQVGDVDPKLAEYYFGMVTPEFVPEPVYYAVKDLAQELSTAGPGSYSVLSAPISARGSWSLSLENGAGSGAATPILVSEANDATLNLSFEGTDVEVELRALAGANGHDGDRLYVAVDGGVEGVAAELPRDEAGRPYVDAGAPGVVAGGGAGVAAPTGEPRRITLVRDLGRAVPPTVHRLELRAGWSGIQLAAFHVRGERSLTQFWLLTGALLLALAIDIALLRRWRAG